MAFNTGLKTISHDLKSVMAEMKSEMSELKSIMKNIELLLKSQGMAVQAHNDDVQGMVEIKNQEKEMNSIENDEVLDSTKIDDVNDVDDDDIKLGFSSSSVEDVNFESLLGQLPLSLKSHQDVNYCVATELPHASFLAGLLEAIKDSVAKGSKPSARIKSPTKFLQASRSVSSLVNHLGCPLVTNSILWGFVVDRGKPLSRIAKTVGKYEALAWLCGGVSFFEVLQALVLHKNTHNFVDVDTIKRLKYIDLISSRLWVAIADGGKIISDSSCPAFHWSIQGRSFISEVRVLPLGGCELVLGVQWLKTISPVTMDFNTLQLSLYALQEITSYEIIQRQMFCCGVIVLQLLRSHTLFTKFCLESLLHATSKLWGNVFDKGNFFGKACSMFNGLNDNELITMAGYLVGIFFSDATGYDVVMVLQLLQSYVWDDKVAQVFMDPVYKSHSDEAFAYGVTYGEEQVSEMNVMSSFDMQMSVFWVVVFDRGKMFIMGITPVVVSASETKTRELLYCLDTPSSGRASSKLKSAVLSYFTPLVQPGKATILLSSMDFHVFQASGVEKLAEVNGQSFISMQVYELGPTISHCDLVRASIAQLVN